MTGFIQTYQLILLGYFTCLFCVVICFWSIVFPVKKPGGFYNEIRRKSLHILSGSIFFISTFWLQQLPFMLLCIEALVAVFLLQQDVLFHIKIRRIRHTQDWGVYLFPLGLFLSSVFYFHGALAEFRTAIIILTVCDTLAAVIGKRFPVKRFYINTTQKSIGGSSAFYISCILLLVLSGTPLLIAAVISLTLTCLEAVGVNGTDNILLLCLAPFLLMTHLYENILILSIIVGLVLLYAQFNYHNKRSGRDVQKVI